MDTLSPSRRSEVMASVKSTGTAPERMVRSALHRAGYRFGRAKGLPGKPDIVLPKHRRIVLVHGCFWHGHEGCTRARLPKTNEAWWAEKVRRNRERDQRVNEQLAGLGWRVHLIWTCELRAARSATQALTGLLTAIATPEVSGGTDSMAAA